MVDQLICDQCSAVFDSNFRLYRHKVKEHGPTLGITTKADKIDSKSNYTPLPKKRKYQGDGHLKHGKKYRKIYSSDDDSDHAELDVNTESIIRKRKYEGDDVSGPSSKKFRKIHSSNEERVNSNPILRRRRKKPKRKFFKPWRDSEESDENNVVDLDVNNKRRHVTESTDDEGNENKRTKHNSQLEPVKRPTKSLTEKLKLELAKYKRYHRSSNNRLNQVRSECDAKISLLSKQLEELREFEGDVELNSLTNAVINSVTIEEFNKIRTLINDGRIYEVLRNDQHIIALQKIFIGLAYGIIPITAPQRIALSEGERGMVKKLENATIGQVRKYLKGNKNQLINLFEVINESLKLIARMYARYGNS